MKSLQLRPVSNQSNVVLYIIFVLMSQLEKTLSVSTQIHLDYFAESQEVPAKGQDVVKDVAMAFVSQPTSTGPSMASNTV
ncbi:hypothetical protein M5G27_27950 [Pseudomonas shahriarae]|uniref:Uncharacterized protein n=1 Tax=Pseudomonas shahriarae TaxID=2745512 RepID=A0A9X4C6D9_9PSED|nr:hypothetical protein [Pseudomonas shahriarae]MDD1011309.1 hypothetical protein [Pseudomonas shahriarae]